MAREISTAGQNAIFALIPRSESLRMLLALVASNLPGRPRHSRHPEDEQRTKILLSDISWAYFDARSSDADPIYVQLPHDAGYGPGQCALLKRHMYGTRRAAEGWQDEFSATLVAFGFVQGSASACIFFHWAAERPSGTYL